MEWIAKIYIFSTTNQFRSSIDIFAGFCHFMDPRISWCSPEQLGPAFKHWLRLWELSITPSINNNNYNTLNKGEGDFIMIQDSHQKENWERQQEYIPLHCKSQDSNTLETGRERKSVFTGETSDNKASTYGLNHSSNLAILENCRHMPWRKPGRRYHDTWLTWLVKYLIYYNYNYLL